MKTKEEILKLWSPLPGEYGEYFSINGSSVAGAQANKLIIWENGEKKVEARATMQCGSYPRWTESGIFWNDNFLNPESGRIYSMDVIKKDFFETPSMPDPTLKTSAGYKPVTFAWSPRADFFLISAEGFDRNGIHHSKLFLLDADGNLKLNLWDGRDFAPKSICVTSEYIITGTRDLMIFDTDGRILYILPGDLLSQRIHISEDEKILLLQTYKSVTILEIETWRKKGVLDGPCLNAALSPDGTLIYTIDFKGTLHAGLATDPRKMIAVPAPGKMVTVDAGNEYAVGAFASGAPVRWILKKELDNYILENLSLKQETINN
jgi:hypothetical protein